MHTHVFVAGTFDRLHKGHETVLRKALEEGKKVTIGITSDAFIHHYKPSILTGDKPVYSFLVRKEGVLSWIRSQHTQTPINVISIEDPYEPAISGDYDSLVITEQNKKTGQEINVKRQAKGLAPLHLIEVTIVSAVDGAPISSTRIRGGEIDPQGNLYLPERLRVLLKRPLGNLILPEDIQSRIPNQLIITVGDVTTDVVLSRGIIPDLTIIDLHARRKPYKPLAEFSFPETIHINHIASGPGFISQQAIEALKAWIQTSEPSVLVVKGEDDLLVLPTILLVPEQTRIYYGQPNEGLVEVIVTQQVKDDVQSLLHQFEY